MSLDEQNAAAGAYPHSYIERYITPFHRSHDETYLFPFVLLPPASCLLLFTLSDWDEMYFGGRWALPINSNPFYILKRDSNSGTETQVPRTARFVTSALKWVRKIRGGLEADKAKGCMSQYHLQFGTGRVPNQGRDVLNTDQTSDHIVVVYKDQYFKVQVLSSFHFK
jgi:hypothetical protein